MSANRSVQAAQRRRAGPTDSGVRPPQPSINSAQIFANQSKQGSGPNVPNGRLAGQAFATQQQKMQQYQQQQQQQQQQEKHPEGIASISKLTIPQAISLITLRLGIVESKLINLDSSPDSHKGDLETMSSSDLYDILNRLDVIEKNMSQTSTSTSTPTDNADLTLMKQQFELLKQTVYQSKTSVTSVLKDNNVFKTQIDTLKKDVSETKTLLESLQQLMIETNQQVLELSCKLDNGSDSMFSNDNNQPDQYLTANLSDIMLEASLEESLDKSLEFENNEEAET